MNKEQQLEYRQIKYQQIFHHSSQYVSLALLRIQSFTILSGISIAVFAGFINFSEKVHNIFLAALSFMSFSAVIIIGLSRFLEQSKAEMKFLEKIIKEVPRLNPGENFKTPRPQYYAYWPEVLYILFIIGILLFIFSLIDFKGVFG